MESSSDVNGTEPENVGVLHTSAGSKRRRSCLFNDIRQPLTMMDLNCPDALHRLAEDSDSACPDERKADVSRYNYRRRSSKYCLPRVQDEAVGELSSQNRFDDPANRLCDQSDGTPTSVILDESATMSEARHRRRSSRFEPFRDIKEVDGGILDAKDSCLLHNSVALGTQNSGTVTKRSADAAPLSEVGSIVEKRKKRRSQAEMIASACWHPSFNLVDASELSFLDDVPDFTFQVDKPRRSTRLRRKSIIGRQRSVPGDSLNEAFAEKSNSDEIASSYIDGGTYDSGESTSRLDLNSGSITMQRRAYSESALAVLEDLDSVITARDNFLETAFIDTFEEEAMASSTVLDTIEEEAMNMLENVECTNKEQGHVASDANEDELPSEDVCSGRLRRRHSVESAESSSTSFRKPPRKLSRKLPAAAACTEPDPAELEKLYTNKCYTAPVDQSLETIYEQPQCRRGQERVMSVVRSKRRLAFEQPSSASKTKQRRQKARQLGWRPLSAGSDAECANQLMQRLNELDKWVSDNLDGSDCQQEGAQRRQTSPRRRSAEVDLLASMMSGTGLAGAHSQQ